MNPRQAKLDCLFLVMSDTHCGFAFSRRTKSFNDNTYSMEHLITLSLRQ